jgi:hypothetical protein
VAFADHALLSSFKKLKSGRFEEKQFATYIERAIDDLKENPFSGVAVRRNLWPREYVKKHSIDNLRKYDLPNGWRLLYTVQGNEIEIISILLEWLSHKEYEKKFGYNVT